MPSSPWAPVRVQPVKDIQQTSEVCFTRVVIILKKNLPTYMCVHLCTRVYVCACVYMQGHPPLCFLTDRAVIALGVHRRAAGQADGRVHRVHLLLTGSGLHVAGVASRAAVLAVLTAHGLRGTKGPGTLTPTNVPSHLRRGPRPDQEWAGGHSRAATCSRPRPPSGSGSRSAPPGSWCAGHSPCLWGGTGRPCGQALCPVRSPPVSPSYSAFWPHTCSPSGSSAGGPSSRQPGEMAEKGGLGSYSGP